MSEENQIIISSQIQQEFEKALSEASIKIPSKKAEPKKGNPIKAEEISVPNQDFILLMKDVEKKANDLIFVLSSNLKRYKKNRVQYVSLIQQLNLLSNIVANTKKAR